MKKAFTLLLSSTIFSGISLAQNVGIGTSAPADKLHVVGSIRSSTLAGIGNRTVLANANGTLIIGTGANNPDWTILGNTGTSASTNFIGTTDSVDFVIRTNNIARARVFAQAGRIGIGTAVMLDPLDLVDVLGTATYPYAINGYAAGTGAGVYGESSATAGSVGVYGNSSSTGVLGQSNNNGYGGIFGINTNVRGTGIFGVGSNQTPAVSLVHGPGIAGTADTVGVFGIGKNTTLGTGVVGFGNNVAIGTLVARGQGVSGTGINLGVTGFATTGLSGTAAAPNAGGYFEAALGASSVYAYVGAYASGTPSLTYKILGSGTASTIVRDLSNNPVVMFCPEAPEVLFFDYGQGQLLNGFVHIDLDPVFAKNVLIDKNHSLRVFIQLEGDCNGVFVTNKSSNGFDVKELNNGQSNVSFTYMVAANRANDSVSQFSDARFPAAPAGELKKTETTQQFPEHKTRPLINR